MKYVLLLPLLVACTFPRPEDVTFGEAAITITAGDGQTAVSGSKLAEDLIVHVTDADLVPIPNFTVEFTVTLGNGEVSEKAPRTDAQGNARTSFTLGRRAGVNEIDVSGEGISSERIFFQHTGLVGPPSRLVAVMGDGESATVATSIELVTRLEDQYENPVAGMAVDQTTIAGGGTLVIGNDTTDDDGLVRSTLTLGTTSGTNTVEARVPTVAPLVHTITATGGVATSLSMFAGHNVRADALVPAPIVVLARDAYNNPSPGTVIDFTVTNNGIGVLGPATVMTDAQGLATTTVTPPFISSAITTVRAEVLGTTLTPVTFSVPTRSFLGVQSFTGSSVASHLFELGDINEDGKLDLVYVVDTGSVSNVVVRLNTTQVNATTMAFATEVSFPFGTASESAYDFDVGDLDSDGDADIVVTTSSPASTRILANTTASSSPTPVLAAAATVSTMNGEVAIGNLNGDALNDIALANGQLHILRNITASSSIAFDIHSPGTSLSATELRIADVNGDGMKDVVGGQSDTARILRNTTVAATNPTFVSSAATCTSFGTDAALGDLDGDGKSELLAGSSGGSTASNLDVCRNTTVTTPSFAAPTRFATAAESVVAADINGDGKLDVIGVTRDASFSTVAAILLSTSAAGTLSLHPRATFSTGTNDGPSNVRTRVADMNGDSRLDLVFETFNAFRVILSQ